MGRVVVPIEEVVSGQRTEGWFDLVGPTVTHKNGKPIKAQVHLHISITANHSSSLSTLICEERAESDHAYSPLLQAPSSFLLSFL